MQTLLIADSSPVFTSALESALGKQFQIFTCSDGRTALEQLQLLQPDILILNLMLPYMDGLTLLQTSTYHPPVILATTVYMSVYVEQTIAALGVDYTMIAPSVDAVVLRLQDLLQQYTPPIAASDPETKVIYHLRQLNIPTHLDGYRQLCIALPIFAQNPQQLLTKELYPTVARLCRCKDGRSVEHSIRKAIQAAWQHRDNSTWRKYFAFGSQGAIPCPTNKEFLCLLAEILNNHTH